MASRAASSVLFLLVAVSAASAAQAATFTIKNNCGYTVWPAGIPVGGGTQLNPGQTWIVQVSAGTRGGRFWGRTGCSFNGGGSGHCNTGDCAGQLVCKLSGQPATLAEYTIGGSKDFYDISVIDAFNIGMAFSCSSTGERLVCSDASCPDAYHQPNDVKTHACNGNSYYQITFCP